MRSLGVSVLALVVVGTAGCSPGGDASRSKGTTTSGKQHKRRPAVADADGDGVPDFADKCPRRKETRNGFKDGDGCPDVYPLSFGTKRIRLKQRITFVGETRVLTAASREVLTTLAAALRKRPQILLVEIQSHVAATGPADYTRRLTLARAKEVQGSLVKLGGVSKLRLAVKGYGATRPLCRDKTRACRAVNNRIELHIIWQGGKRHRLSSTGSTPGSRALLPPRHRSALTRSAALRLKQRRLRKLFEAGLQLLKKRRFTAAYQRFRTVVRGQPDNLQARLKLGVLQARLGDHTGANETVRWVRNNVGDDAADRLRQAQLKAMARRKP